MKHLTYQALKELWYAFFRQHRHLQIPPVSLVTKDARLLWINSGVAGLKDYFLTLKTPPASRLVNIQNAIRTNDLTLIGKTNRHLTMFEMMGNFAINDYFKPMALKWAWEFLTASKWLHLPKQRLYFTVWENDHFSRDFLQQELQIPASHLLLKSRETNFWDLGVGPCGPNTEIFYDCGEEFDPHRQGLKLLRDDIENDRYLEIWNIVFSEYNNVGNKQYQPLDSKNIDTGAGLERILMILQAKKQLFATDAFLLPRQFLETASQKRFIDLPTSQLTIEQQKSNRAFIIIIDHLRAAIFMLSDLLAAKPQTTFSFQSQRGYVIRRLLRNAFLQLEYLNIRPPFLAQMLDPILKAYQTTYPQLSLQSFKIKTLLEKEEKQILRIWQPKIIKALFNKTSTILPAEAIFNLVTSHGIPLELLETFAFEEGKKLDLKNYYHLFQHHKKISHGKKQSFLHEWTIMTSEQKQPTPFFEHAFNLEGCKVIAFFPHQEWKNHYWVIFDKTPFYAAKGGQVADNGTAIFPHFRANVLDVRLNSYQESLHLLYSPKKPIINSLATLSIDQIKRQATAKNHSATHLLHFLLRQHLGSELQQAGSFNNEDYLRLDFHSLTPKISFSLLNKISQQMKTLIAKAIKPEIIFTTLAEAKKRQALAFFTDRYQNQKVRIVKFGDFSLELCGGTHVYQTSQLEAFLITNCELISRNKWRIYALTGAQTIANFLETWKAKFQTIAELKANSYPSPAFKKLYKQFQTTDLFYEQKTCYQQLLPFLKLIKQKQSHEQITTLIKNYHLPKTACFVVRSQSICFHQVKPLPEISKQGLNFLRHLYDQKLPARALAVLINSDLKKPIHHLFIKLPKASALRNKLLTFLNRFPKQFHYGVRKQSLQGVIKVQPNALQPLLQNLRAFIRNDLFAPDFSKQSSSTDNHK